MNLTKYWASIVGNDAELTLLPVVANIAVLKMDKTHFQECVLDMLSEMFGEDCVGKIVKADKLQINVNNIEATVNLITCVSVR